VALKIKLDDVHLVQATIETENDVHHDISYWEAGGEEG